MKQTLVFTLCVLFVFPLFCQPTYTANDSVPPFSGKLGVGVNMGFYSTWTNINQAVIAAGDPSLGIKGVGATTIRPGMYADVFANFGYTIAQADFTKYHQLGMQDFTGIIGGTPEWQRDYTTYCPGVPSTLFKDMYLPIWDNSDGTPINESNHFAYYMYRMVNMYKDDVTFWEIWNEPGFDYTNGNGRKQPGEPGNWWDNDPDPCDYKLRAPIQHYVRMLRISWEVIKTLDPSSYVTLGDPGFPSFLDAILRNTDNPNGGAVTAAYPLKGGAYFDCMTYHSYPHFDFTAYDPAINLFKRHSDGGADGLIVARDRFQNVLNNYGYNGITYPKKLWNVTEYNAPRRAITGPWMNGQDLQVNYLLKVLMRAKVEKITQMHIYNLFDVRSDAEAVDEFDLMGMYATNTGVLPYQQTVMPQGKAMATFTKMLGEASYDPAATAALNLPASIGGYAFRLPNDSLVYALWAKTVTDLSETASATYSFPAALGIDSLFVFQWDYGYTDQKTTKSRVGLTLTARPQFFKRREAHPCLLSTTISNISCNDNGTPTVTTDDKWSFQLLVQGGSNAQGWRATIGGTVVTGQYGVSKSLSGLLISAGNLSFVVADVASPTCTKAVAVSAPLPCSTPPAANYCASHSEFPWHDWIAGFAVGGINNSSGKSQYSDFTSLSTTLVPGTTYQATLTPGFSWLAFQENWRVWIDFNKNKVFEASEIVLSYQQPGASNGAGNNAVTRPLVIPANALTGTTRMRVSMQRGTFAGPCDLLSFGEVEDYTVNISGTQGSCSISVNISDITCNDNGTPTVGSDDTYTCKALVTGTNTSTGWTALTGGSSVVSGSYGQARTLGPFSILTNTQVTFRDAVDATCTTFTEIVRPNPCSNGGGNGTYCSSVSDFPWHDWIAQIKVADLDHVTGKSPYTHYPDKIATVRKGQSHIIQLTAGFSWLSEDEYWRIFIDYNKDGVFTTNEIAFSQLHPKSPFPVGLWSVNGSITIPTTAPEGITRMRIVMQRGSTPPNPCGNYAFGETEDYSINITSGSGGSNCTISAVSTNISCQNKGTSTPTDDTYSFELLVTGAGNVSPLGWRATYGTTTISGAYGTPKLMPQLPISGGNLTIVVRDSASATCAQTLTVTPPAPCSNNVGPCTVTSAHPWHDWITGVKFSTLNQTSGKSTYSDFSNIVTTVRRDSTYALTLKAGYSWFAYPNHWRIWVDNNNDGEWSSSEIVYERSFAAGANGLSELTINDTIRFSTISPGRHKMRVILRRDGFPDPCGIIDFGEAEDYAVNVVTALNSSQGTVVTPTAEFDENWVIYPNPARDFVAIGVENPLTTDAHIRLIDALGQIVHTTTLPAHTQWHELYTTALTTGIYQVRISVAGQRDVLRKLVIVKE